MNVRHVKYLLAGGGLASSSAAQAIRRLDPDGEMMLIGQEVVRPYHRPPLSKELLRGQKPREDLFTLPAEWFVENRVELRTGRRVCGLDVARRSAALDTGEEVVFDKLLIATGASPKPLKVPGAELPNVFYLRTLGHLEILHNAIVKALAEGRRHSHGRGSVCVIGGGVLGVELAATFSGAGLAVDLVVSRCWPWDRFAGETLGRLVTRRLESRGVAVHIDSRPERLEGDGRVQRVVLDDGRIIECDFVVAAIGMSVNKDLLRGTPIIAERAILTDDHCRTNVPGIYAAGDCAAVYDALFSKHRIMDHWDNAVVTGTIAGENMAGGDRRYDAVNYFFSDAFDLKLSVWGESRHIERRIVRGTPNCEKPDLIEFGIAADGRLAQVAALNHEGEDERLRELVRRRLRMEGLEEQLRDPTMPLP